MNYSGKYINTVLGTVFLLTGIGVLFIGILLKLLVSKTWGKGFINNFLNRKGGRYASQNFF